MRFVYCHFKKTNFYTNNNFPSARFVAYFTLGERVLGSIGQEDSGHMDTSVNMSGGRWVY